MGFEAPMTIAEAIENIHGREYVLPAIQREFVWRTDQIVSLFDSLLRAYPIGSFLYWYVEEENLGDYEFYEFIREYHERDKRHNPKADVTGSKGVIAILDGQQRLTALYIGLKGTYSVKTPRKRWDKDSSFPKRRLFLNLLNAADGEELNYDFRFLTDEESSERSEDTFWFRVGEILTLRELHDVNTYIKAQNLDKGDPERVLFTSRTLTTLFSAIQQERVLNYYLEKSESLDKVLNIFIRVNSGGTELSYSDLLLSIATAQWKYRDAREEITHFVDEINNLGSGFNFNKDFVLKSCLVMTGLDMKFKVDNFNKKNMLLIEEQWGDISDAILLAVNLLVSFGYSRETLVANNTVIPIAYYLRQKRMPHNFVEHSSFKADRKAIKDWVIRALLKKVFGGQPDAVLRPMREILDKGQGDFPYDTFLKHFKGPKKLSFDKDEVENLFFNEYGQRYTFSTLALLYPTLDFKNTFHQDHIFPQSRFRTEKLRKQGIPESKNGYFKEQSNMLANLQLISGIPNLEKRDQDFKKWLEKTYPDMKERKEFMRLHYIPDTDLELKNFDTFIEKRKALMMDEFRRLLSLG